MLVTPTWKTYQSKFGEIMSNMTRHYRLVEMSATVAQIEDFQKARKIDDDRFETERRDEDLRRLKTVYDWLRPAGVENDHYEFMKTRAAFPDTGRWLLDHPTFQEWFDPHYPMVPPLLWLNGIPGAGKSLNFNISIFTNQLQGRQYWPPLLSRKLESLTPPQRSCTSIANIATQSRITFALLHGRFLPKRSSKIEISLLTSTKSAAKVARQSLSRARISKLCLKKGSTTVKAFTSS